MQEKINDIKDTWEIYKIFESERQKFKEEEKEYSGEIQSYQEILRDYRQKIKLTKLELEGLQKKIKEEEEALSSLKEKKDQHKILEMMQTLQQQKKQIQEKKRKIMPNALKEVKVYNKHGKIAGMQPAENLYGEELYQKYRVALKESRELKNKISDLELENRQLRIEVRDSYAELALQELGEKM
ncbi:nickel-binding protein Mua [Helicobacter mustelae]|uniref:nickel-binding protein Mua n=1 Tax=Helicobacter mustelae TaxID=217 RepID=UPI0011C01D3B|nr:nickel-binding protein Mua [Helicobacter mustelae]